jgi:hypothetical protein
LGGIQTVKLLQLAWLNAILLLAGFGLAILGFALSQPVVRTISQVLALVSLGGTIWTGQLLALRWRHMIEES